MNQLIALGRNGPHDDTIDTDGVASCLQHLLDLLFEREGARHDRGKPEQPLWAGRGLPGSALPSPRSRPRSIGWTQASEVGRVVHGAHSRIIAALGRTSASAASWSAASPLGGWASAV